MLKWCAKSQFDSEYGSCHVLKKVDTLLLLLFVLLECGKHVEFSIFQQLFFFCFFFSFKVSIILLITKRRYVFVAV